MQRQGREVSPDPLDCIGEVLNDDPVLLIDITLKPPSRSHSTEEDGQRYSPSTKTRPTVNPDRPAKKQKIWPESPSNPSETSSRNLHPLPPRSPKLSLSSSFTDVKEDEEIIELPDDDPISSIMTNASDALPPIASAGVLPSESSDRAEIEASSEPLPNAHDLVEAMKPEGLKTGRSLNDEHPTGDDIIRSKEVTEAAGENGDMSDDDEQVVIEVKNDASKGEASRTMNRIQQHSTENDGGAGTVCDGTRSIGTRTSDGTAAQDIREDSTLSEGIIVAVGDERDGPSFARSEQPNDTSAASQDKHLERGTMNQGLPFDQSVSGSFENMEDDGEETIIVTTSDSPKERPHDLVQDNQPIGSIYPPLAQEKIERIERNSSLPMEEDYADGDKEEIIEVKDSALIQKDVEMDNDVEMVNVEGEEELDPMEDPMEVDEEPVTGQRALIKPENLITPDSPSSGTSTPVQSKKGSAKTKAEKLKPKSQAKKGTKSKPKSKVEDLKSSGTTPLPSSKDRSVSVADSCISVSAGSDQLERGADQTELYCLCRKVFDEEDEEGVMVGCDGCEGWFHPSCIKIKEEDVPMLDMYICPNCESTTTQRTTWKRICKREGCGVSVTGRPSKYCSSSCAFQHMAGQIPPQASNKLLKQLSSAFIGLPKPVLGITTTSHQAVASLPVSDNLASVQNQIKRVESAIEILQKRLKILENAMTTCENLALVPLHTTSTANPKKKKGAQRSGGEDRPCGWTERIIWDDESVSNVLPGDETGEVCLNPRRRCDRHQGWQKTVPISLEAELVTLEREKDLLCLRLEQVKEVEKPDAPHDSVMNEPREIMKRYLTRARGVQMG